MTTPMRIGTVPTYDVDLFESLLTEIFKERGQLKANDPRWNCYARVVMVLAEAHQDKYPDENVPGDTWLKEFVKRYLNSNPHLDLVVPRRRRR